MNTVRIGTLNTRTVTIEQFLTAQQIEACKVYVANADTSKAVKDIEYGIIRPYIYAINKKLGQENDPRYLAYMVYFVLSHQQNPS